MLIRSAPRPLETSRRDGFCPRRAMSFLALAGLLILLSGCTPLIQTAQPECREAISFSAGEIPGQTFTARFAGLQGVALLLQPGTAGDGQVLLHLSTGPGQFQDLARASLPLAHINSAGYYRFSFPAQNTSSQADYYAWLEIQGGGSLRLCQGAPDSFLDGAAYRQHSPLEAQWSFRLVYDRGQAAAGVVLEAAGWLGRLALAAFLYLLPGWGLLSLLWPGWSDLYWPEKMGLAGGASLAAYPVLVLWTGLAGWALGAWTAWLPPLAGLSCLAGGFLLRRPTFRFNVSWRDLGIAALMGTICGVRLWAIRNLEAPMYGDGMQHTMIVQLLLEHGGLFNNWQPYADLTTFTYHFGFHSLAAVWAWLSGSSASQATLWTGQLLNALAIIFLFPLATRLGRHPWAGCVALLVGGLLAPMPMYYTNWGRYTQLAGQAILPAAIYGLWELLEQPGQSWRRMSVCWLWMGGLALTHYRILILAVLFFGLALAVTLLQVWRRTSARRESLGLVGRAAAAAAGAGLLFLPWFLHVYAGAILQAFVVKASTPVTRLSEGALQSNTIGDLAFYLPGAIWLLSLAALVWGIWRREGRALLLAAWWGLNLLAANPAWIGWPGTGILSTLTIMIAAYIPAAILSGAAAGWLSTEIAGRSRLWEKRLWNIGAAALVLLAGVYGARQRLNDVQASIGALWTRPDARAARWIQANTPARAAFLVNTFFAFDDQAIVGADGGWWLPLQTGRAVNLPPLNYVFEQGGRADHIAWTNQVSQVLREKGPLHPDTLALLRQRGLDYVYIGQRQGSVNNGGARLNPVELLQNPAFQAVYHQDRVWILQLKALP